MIFGKREKVFISLFVCAFASLLLDGRALAKVTPKKVDEPTSSYVIQKGDALSHLAVKYFGSAVKWREFEKYNDFTNVNLILPGESIQVPQTMDEKAKAEAEAKAKAAAAEAEAAAKRKAEEAAKKAAESKKIGAEAKEKMAELQKKLEAANSEIKLLKASLEDVKESEMKLKELRAANEKLHNAFIEKDKQVSELKGSINSLEKTIQNAGAQFSKNIESALSGAKGAPDLGVGKGIDKIYQESEEISKKVENLEEGISKISSQVGSIEKSLSEQPKETPKSEPKLSKKAKSAALITTLIGTAIWIVANAVSSTK